MNRVQLEKAVARAIRTADTRWFNEDYDVQARAALEAARRCGFSLVPKEPTGETIEDLIDNIPIGRMKPEDLIRAIYNRIVSHHHR